MTKYNTLNIKFSNSQFNKIKSAIKNGTEVTLNLSLNLIGSSNDETNFPHKLLLTDTGLPLIKSVLTPLAKSVFIPLGLSAGISAAADAAIQKKIYGSGRHSWELASRVTVLIISNEEMGDIVKTVKSFEESG